MRKLAKICFSMNFWITLKVGQGCLGVYHTSDNKQAEWGKEAPPPFAPAWAKEDPPLRDPPLVGGKDEAPKWGEGAQFGLCSWLVPPKA